MKRIQTETEIKKKDSRHSPRNSSSVIINLKRSVANVTPTNLTLDPEYIPICT